MEAHKAAVCLARCKEIDEKLDRLPDVLADDEELWLLGCIAFGSMKDQVLELAKELVKEG